YLHGRQIGSRGARQQAVARPGASADARREQEQAGRRSRVLTRRWRTHMAEPSSQQIGQTTTGATEVSEFDSLLRKEFKPKTDEAKEAAGGAVPPLAEQARRDSQLSTP